MRSTLRVAVLALLVCALSARPVQAASTKTILLIVGPSLLLLGAGLVAGGIAARYAAPHADTLMTYQRLDGLQDDLLIPGVLALIAGVPTTIIGARMAPALPPALGVRF